MNKSISSNSNFSIKINNFGPISSGEINLKPFSIFIGANNLGKSYAAMLVHSILKSIYEGRYLFIIGTREWESPIRYFFSHEVPLDVLVEFDDIIYGNSKKMIEKLISDKNRIEEIRKIVSQLKDKSEIKISKNVTDYIQKIISNYFLDQFIKLFSSETKRLWATNEFKDLIKGQSKKFKINLDFTFLNFDILYEKNRLICRNINYLSPEIFLIKRTSKNRIMFKLHNNTGKDSKSFKLKIDKNFQLTKEEEVSKLIFRLFTLFLKDFNMKFGNLISKKSYYLPATRSGLLQGHKALSSAFIKLSSQVGLKPMDFPTLSGIVSDFIAQLIQIEKLKKRKFSELDLFLEKNVIKGDITIQQDMKSTYPEILYSIPSGMDIPLYRSSSMVSELAPLIIYQKYIIKENSLLIIEEPESHLHPDAQRNLSQYLVKLRRAGHRILITTHSDFLLEQLNIFILLNEKKPEELKYNKNDFLKPEEVAIYNFKYDTNLKEVIIQEIEISKEGITKDIFEPITEGLYNEKIKVSESID